MEFLQPCLVHGFALKGHTGRNTRGDLRPSLIATLFRRKRLPCLHVGEPIHRLQRAAPDGFHQARHSSCQRPARPELRSVKGRGHPRVPSSSKRARGSARGLRAGAISKDCPALDAGCSPPLREVRVGLAHAEARRPRRGVRRNFFASSRLSVRSVPVRGVPAEVGGRIGSGLRSLGVLASLREARKAAEGRPAQLLRGFA